jgi:hypothetical protein
LTVASLHPHHHPDQPCDDRHANNKHQDGRHNTPPRLRWLSERYAGIRTEEFLLHAAVAVAENAAVQHAKLGGLLGLSPVAERGLSFTPTDRSHAF